MSRAFVVLSGVLAALLSIVLSGPVIARPRYQAVFEKLYPDLATKKINCAMCHPGSDKKKNNHYAKALEKELGEKAVKDEKIIKEALLKLEEGECRSGKWGKRLDEGLAPCVCREFDPSKSVIQRFLDRAEQK